MGKTYDARLDLDGVYVVVPAYREAEVIAQTVRTLVSFCRHIVVVDDGSPDATAERACEAGATVLRHPVNLGQGAALQTGIDFALKNGAAFVATFDADGQHAAADLKTMLAVLRENDLDIVLGSRFLGRAEGLPRLRWLALKLAVLFTNLTTGLGLTDTHNGLRVMTAAAARRFHLTQDRMAHASEIISQIARLNLRFREVQVTIRYSEDSLRKGQKVSGSVRILTDLLIGWLTR